MNPDDITINDVHIPGGMRAKFVHCADCQLDAINCTCDGCRCLFCVSNNCSCQDQAEDVAEDDEHEEDGDDEMEKLITKDYRGSLNLGSLFRQARQSGMIAPAADYR